LYLSRYPLNKNLHPGEGRDPFGRARNPEKWIPAFAGMTTRISTYTIHSVTPGCSRHEIEAQPRFRPVHRGKLARGGQRDVGGAQIGAAEADIGRVDIGHLDLTHDLP